MLLRSRKSVLLDGSPREGVGAVLLVLDDEIIARYLASGVHDITIRNTVDTYDEHDVRCQGMQQYMFCPLPPHMHQNEGRDSRRSLLKLRLEGFRVWRRYVTGHLDTLRSFYEPVEEYMADEVAQSSKGEPSMAMEDYARARGWASAEVYEYFKLLSRERAHHLLIIHAKAERYAEEINMCSTKESIDAVLERMQREF